MSSPLPGVLCLVVGPSGAGKDTLIDGARERLGADFRFPRRVITRRGDAGGEAHDEVSLERFEAIEADGGFALSWRAHSLAYGVPASAAQGLLGGVHQVVNVSRTMIDAARERFPYVRVFSIRVPEAILRERLFARGRETADAVEARVARARAFEVAGDDVVEIVNDAAPAQAIDAFVSILRQTVAGAR